MLYYSAMEKLLRNEEIIHELRKFGIDINTTTLEYYTGLSLIPKSTKIPGDNRAYQPYSVIKVLYIISFMQKQLGFNAKEIASISKQFKEQNVILNGEKIKSDNILLLWMDLSYTHFFDFVYSTKPRKKNSSAIRNNLFINWIYKNSFQDLGIDYLEKELKKRATTDLNKTAKEWAKKISEPFRN